MAVRIKPSIESFIIPLNMNGLHGRMLKMPAYNKRHRNILLIYDRHSTIERWSKLIESLNTFGNVTVPDLPGFGGMQSLYHLHEKPTIDKLADYVAAFVKLRYKKQKFTIVGMGFGFAVFTRMLQRYPHLTRQVDMAISLGGYAHKSDFVVDPIRRKMIIIIARIGAIRSVAWLTKFIGLQSFVLKFIYQPLLSDDVNLKTYDVKNNISLWRDNDMRTRAATLVEELTLDNCDKRVHLPLWHVPIVMTKQMDEQRVSQHLQVIYDQLFTVIKQNQHSVNTQATSSIHSILPIALRRQLAKRLE